MFLLQNDISLSVFCYYCIFCICAFAHFIHCIFTFMCKYSKTCVKWPLKKKRQNKGLNDNWKLNERSKVLLNAPNH